MPRLNGLMALIAVMCIAGVVSGELLGPMSRLRSWTHQSPGLNQARIIRAGLAGDAFVFAPQNQPIAAPPPAPPPPVPHLRPAVPPPVPSSVVFLPASGDGDQGPDPPPYELSSQGLSGAVYAADFESSTSPTDVPSSPNADPTSVGLAQAVPEPASWLMLIFGLGGIGLALRRRRAGSARTPDTCSSPQSGI
jgi:hypothetical protein